MKKVSADYIFPVKSPPIKNGIIIIDNKGVIKEILDPGKIYYNPAEVESYKGILVPGFVNTHTHLELSHLKGKIKPGNGLPGFLHNIMDQRLQEDSIIEKATERGIAEMEKNGIVAAGDIANTSITFPFKVNSKIRFHTFIEVFDLIPEKAKEKISEGIKLLNMIEQNYTHPASISPHAPYSVSSELLTEISKYLDKHPGPVTFHNQECTQELKMFSKNEGKLKYFIEQSTAGLTNWRSPGKSSLLWMNSNLPGKLMILPVHNTYTPEKDIKIMCRRVSPVYWTLCPGANLFIENKLPDIKMIMKYTDKIVIGTDSLASNHKLSVLNELIILQNNFPGIELEKLIKWGTLNGAHAINMDNEFGSIEKGKKPGINLISGVDLNNMKLTNESNVKPII